MKKQMEYVDPQLKECTFQPKLIATINTNTVNNIALAN